jgi:hypothetical protein
MTPLDTEMAKLLEKLAKLLEKLVVSGDQSPKEGGGRYWVPNTYH